MVGVRGTSDGLEYFPDNLRLRGVGNIGRIFLFCKKFWMTLRNEVVQMERNLAVEAVTLLYRAITSCPNTSTLLWQMKLQEALGKIMLV